MKEAEMPKSPQGQIRPADTVGATARVAKIVTGEIQDDIKSGRVESGKADAAKCTSSSSFEKRNASARKAAHTRWDE